MSDTPETDKAKRSWKFFHGQEVVNVHTARKLERDRDYLKAMVTAASTQLDVALRERDEARMEAGSGARSRAEDLPTHTSPHGADVPEAKGRVPLDELKDYLETKAAKHETLRDSYAEASWSHHRDHNEKRAADFRLWLTALAELRGAPRPQSERSEDAPEAALAFKIRYFNEKAVEHDRAASKAQLEGLSRKHPKVVRHRTTAEMCQQLAADLETMLPEGVGAGASGLPNVNADRSEP